MIFRTALCDLLGIDYPILQSGMGGVAGPELVAEVAEVVEAIVREARAVVTGLSTRVRLD